MAKSNAERQRAYRERQKALIPMPAHRNPVRADEGVTPAQSGFTPTYADHDEPVSLAEPGQPLGRGTDSSLPAVAGRNVAAEVVKRLITEDEWRSAVESLWEIATSGTKPDWVWCPHCRKKIQADRVDLRARVEAAKNLQDMGYGKPQVEDQDRQGIVLHRRIVQPKGV